MSRYISGIIAVVLVIAISAFAKINANKINFATTDFHFDKIVAGTETLYEDPGSWTPNPGNPTCNGGPNPCVIRIDNTKLTTGMTLQQKLANYLAAQTGGSSDYASAEAAVAALKISDKPIGQ